jgi:MFS family permease
METTEPDRGLFGSIPQMGVTIGLLLGTFVMSLMTLMPDETFMVWGWRIPFLLSALLVVFGLWVRHGIDETPSFKKVQETGRVAKVPLMETLRCYGIAGGVWELLCAGGFIYCVSLAYFASCGLVCARPQT